MKRACGYVRVSTDEQKKHGWSIDAHKRLIKERCEAEDWQLIRVFDDGGLSGAKEDRPGLQTMLSTLDQFDVIVVPALDRLTRDLFLYAKIVSALTEAGVELITLSGSIDLTTPEGEAMAAVTAVFGQLERSKIKQRVKDSKKERARAGGHNGGPRAYGYTYEKTGAIGKFGKEIRRLVIVLAEAEVVRRIFNDAESGCSQRSIARALTREGIPPREGGVWHQSRIAHMLSNPLYAGLVRVGEELVQGQHEAIITVEQWEKVNESRSTPRRRAGGRPPKGKHLLVRGVLRCGRCGSAMIPRIEPNRWDYESYKCRGRNDHGPEFCQQRSIKRETVDAALLAALTSRYVDLDETRRRIAERQSADLVLAQHTVDQCELELAKVKRRLSKVTRGWQDEVISDADFQKQNAELSSERDAASAAVEQARKGVAGAESLSQVQDAEETLLRHLADLQKQVSAGVDRAPDLPALRTMIGQLFERIELVEWPGFGQSGEGFPDKSLPVGDGRVLLVHLRSEQFDLQRFEAVRKTLPISDPSELAKKYVTAGLPS